MERITLDSSRGAVPAVLVTPEGAGPHPGVVVIHDITGFQPDTERHCHKLAAAGYAAIAPDLMAGVRCVVSTLVSMVTERGPALDAIQAARTALADREDVHADRIGVIGFCMGGGFALLAAADGAFAVAAPFYGTVPRSAARLRGICPTLAQFGAEDIPFRHHAARLSRHLEALGVPHEVIMRPGVGHAFMNQHDGALINLGRYTPLRAAHDPPTEAVAFDALLAFFADHMGGSSGESAR